VTGAELAESLGARRLVWALFGLAGMLVLLWPLYNSVYPIPDFPRNLWPYVIIAWIFSGVLLVTFRPALGGLRYDRPAQSRPRSLSA
jgi:hypothetical protein